MPRTFDGIQYHTAADISRLSGFTPNWVRRLWREGKIPGRRINGRILFQWDEVKRALVEVATGIEGKALSEQEIQEFDELNL